jgi:hypothetical protein
MAVVENLDAYLIDFGIALTLNAVSVRGIFDNGFSNQFSVDGVQPTLMVKSTDAASTVRGHAVVIDTVSYTVQGIEPDGTGMTRLILEKV